MQYFKDWKKRLNTLNINEVERVKSYEHYRNI